METVLETRNLRKVFSAGSREQVLAVDDVSFTVGVGEKVAIIGESGSGKTTVAKLVTRLLAVTSGQIFLDGVDITNARGNTLKQAYRKMQMVFQAPIDSFDPRCTLGDGIAESLRNHGATKAEAQAETARLLALCGLSPDLGDCYPYEVSGGQCQRAAIARALAIKPQLLILDEATSALDVTVQAEILTLLNHLQQELSMSYLFICHDIALVQDFCDRVLVMHNGRIVEEGTADAVIRHPQMEYTQMLIDSVL
ncbi:MAG: ATP-binding cassette domain-containing protein [Selenomonas sp.]|uniref:ABC transporter ATP-binding protein n=1 Tax=Selenomonas sp. TaxID=2053611 RepID=UPI0025E1A349|nr:ABC transporter ATP-binding protein [Selenomonas sp.]MCR5439258.1 ATP-binding cassette domain-containing protein [Selenomonas sp.]